MLPASRRGLAFGIAAAAALVSALLFWRHGRLLGFDQYYYCELAKQYQVSWPAAFGNHWPCGYPLYAGLLGRVGVPAYWALSTLSIVALGSIVAMSVAVLRGSLTALPVLLAMVLLPVLTEQVLNCSSELPFTAAWLGLGVALGQAPKPSALWLAAACAVLALTIRYVGIVSLGVLWCWGAWNFRSLRQAGKIGTAIAAFAAASLAEGGLLFWNLRTTGYLSGASRDGSGPIALSSVFHHAANLGWSLPTACMLGGLRRLAGAHPPLELGLGVVIWALVACVFVRSWWSARQGWLQAVALIGCAYWFGMVVLRTMGNFDDLYTARTFLPAAVPLFLLLGARIIERAHAGIFALCAAAVLVGVAADVRGVSRAIAGDIRPAVAALQPRLQAGDQIQLNDDAFTLAAYVNQRTARVFPQFGLGDRPARFLVLAATPADRDGARGTIDPRWLVRTRELTAQGSYRWLLQEPGLLVLERTAPAPPP